MSGASDNQIVEALADHRKAFRWSSGNGYFCDCGKRIASAPEDVQGCWEAHQAEVIEPIIKARVAEGVAKENQRVILALFAVEGGEAR